MFLWQLSWQCPGLPVAAQKRQATWPSLQGPRAWEKVRLGVVMSPAVHTVCRAQNTLQGQLAARGTERWWCGDMDVGRPGLTSCSESPNLSVSQPPPE